MGIKERRTKILIALFFIANPDKKGSYSFVELGGTASKLFDLILNQKTKSTLSSLIKEELIEESKDEKGQYRLTSKGVAELCMHFPYFRFLHQQWDNKWRILSYEIPEKKRDLRDRLRREVSGWGLGPWHRSFWLTPHPIIENLQKLVRGKEEEAYIQAFEADHAFGDKDVLIEKVWGKSQLDKKYRELFKKWHDTLATDQDKIAKLKSVIREYVAVLRLDPGLPPELIGKDWIGFEAFTIFKEVKSILLS